MAIQHAPPPTYSPATPAAPESTPQSAQPPRHRGLLVLAIAALTVAIAAGVMAGGALIRLPAKANMVSQDQPEPSPTAPSAGEVDAAKKAACDAWSVASAAINAARQSFIDSPPSWDDPVTIAALSQAQSGVLIQIEYLRQRLSPLTPNAVAAPIHDYIAAAVDTVAADGQHQPAAVSNAAADRSTAAANRIRTACGL